MSKEVLNSTKEQEVVTQRHSYIRGGKRFALLGGPVLSFMLLVSCGGNASAPSPAPTEVKSSVPPAPTESTASTGARTASADGSVDTKKGGSGSVSPSASGGLGPSGSGSPCNPAEQVATWPPNPGSKEGHDIEVTASDNPTTGEKIVEVDLWSPPGDTPFGNEEIETILPPGMSILAPNKAGTAWSFDASDTCTVDEVKKIAQAHINERKRNGENINGSIFNINDLISKGYVLLRYKH